MIRNLLPLGIQRVLLTGGFIGVAVVRQTEHALVMHPAVENYVDRSIDGPGTLINGNFTVKFTLLQAVRAYWEQLPVNQFDRAGSSSQRVGTQALAVATE